MEGNAFVQYSGIGGRNMDSDISTLGLDGSVKTSESETGGTITLMFYVNWQLPGGIINKGSTEPQGAWGYILGRGDSQQNPYTDQEFCQHLAEKYGYTFDDDYNLVSGDEVTVKNTINRLVAEYFNRVVNGSGLEEGYDWSKMNVYYDSCLTRNV